MDKIMIFGGTTEGRILCEKCVDKKDIMIDVYVATEKGASVLPKASNIRIHIGRLNEIEMKAEYKLNEPDMVIDATHPFALEVTENIKYAVDINKYVRLLRDENDKVEHAMYVENMDKAITVVNRSKGNVLMTTGSKELEKYANIKDFKSRVYVRMLPDNISLRTALSLGMKLSHIIDDDAPFTVEQNMEHIQSNNIKYLITKDSGDIGGFMEKYEAAIRSNILLIVIQRPKEKGYNLDEVLEKIDNLKNIKRVYIIGIGMGSKESMTIEAKNAIDKCEVVIGAKRVVDSVDDGGNRDAYYEYRPDKIKHFIDNRLYRKIAVVYSGDICLYSGATELIDKLVGHEVKIIQGVSSISYLAARMGIDWANTKILSMHARELDIVKEVSENKGVFALTGDNIPDICKRLCAGDLGDAKICIGEKLSYDDEKIYVGYVHEFINHEFDTIATIYIENDKYGKKFEIGIDDDLFIRDNVPMTKSETRAIALSMLNISSTDIVYDIGAGTGSVTVEMAKAAYDGVVYSIERTAKGVKLIDENCKKFGVNNAHIVQGYAEEVIESLPKADAVFIGGTNGKMNQILDIISNKGKTTVVITAITLETVYKTIEYFNQRRINNVEIKQVSVSRGKKVVGLNMLVAENPIFIIKAEVDKYEE